MIASQIKLKIFVEGIEIKSWTSISMNTGINAGVSASLSIPDDGVIFASFIPGVKVSIFMNRQAFMKGVEEGEFVLLFEGECQKISRSSGTKRTGRNVILNIHGWIFYSKLAKTYHFDQASTTKDVTLLDNTSTSPSSISADVVDDVLNRRTSVSTGLGTEEQMALNRQKKRNFKRKAIYKKLFAGKPLSGFSRNSKNSSHEDGGLEHLLENFFYFFAYLSNSSGSGGSEIQKLFRVIFESAKLRKKFFIISDKENNTAFDPQKTSNHALVDAAKNNHWFQFAMEQAFHRLGHIGRFFDFLSYLLGETAYTFCENLAPSKVGSDNINQIFLKPNLFFALPPKCNILFPGNIDSVQCHRSFDSEPTAAFRRMPMIKQLGSGSTSNLTREGIEQTNLLYAKTQANSIPGVLNRFIDEHRIELERIDTANADMERMEKLKGPNHYIDTSGSVSDFLLTTVGATDLGEGGELRALKKENVKLFNAKTQYNYMETLYSGRVASINMPFSPYMIVGHPAMVLEDLYVTIGLLDSIAHSFTPSSAETSIRLRYTRTSTYDLNNIGDASPVPMDFFNKHYRGNEIDKIYKDFFGTSSLEIDGTIDTSGNDQNAYRKLYDKMRKASRILRREYFEVPKENRNAFTEKYHERSFVKEGEYFSIMGAKKTDKKTYNDIYEAESIDGATDKNTPPFIKEKQAPIIQYVNNINQRAQLEKKNE